MPFPFAINKCCPSGVTLTEVGYQPAGMNPKDCARAGLLISKTAIMLLSAFATNNVVSSAVKARLLGVEPGKAFGKRAEQIVSVGFPVSVSKTVTVLRLAFATNSRLPDWVRAISQGCSCVGQRAMTLLEFKSITSMLAWPHRLT